MSMFRVGVLHDLLHADPMGATVFCLKAGILLLSDVLGLD